MLLTDITKERTVNSVWAQLFQLEKSVELSGQTCMPTPYDSLDLKKDPIATQELHFLRTQRGQRGYTVKHLEM